MARTAKARLSPNRRKAASPGSPAAPALGEVKRAGIGPNPGNLAMRLFVPEGLPAGAPLVVVLHGCTQTAADYAAGAGWLTLAQRHGFAVLCPEQKRVNNPNLCFNWFQPGDTARALGEAASIHGMVQWALKAHGLDPKQVFVTGLSAGGAMTAVMLATYPEVFAAGAVIAGLAYGAAASIPEAFSAMKLAPAKPGPSWGDKVREAAPDAGVWPTISIWHGTTDTTVRPAAGEELLRQWIDVHGVADEPQTVTTADGRSFEVWKTSGGRTVVEMHRIIGMAHGAPLQTGGADGSGVEGPFLLEVGISSSLEVAQTWGIAPAEPGALKGDLAAADPVAESPAAAPVSRLASPMPLPLPPTPITEVIEAALRTAGLMR